MSLIWREKTHDFGEINIYSNRPDFDLVEVKQTHSTIIQDYNMDLVPDEMKDIEADGIRFKNGDSTPFAIKTADCLPIYLRGRVDSVFLHAGHKGLASGILKNEKIKQVSPHYAYIGPCIKKCCFLVTTEFKDNFPRSDHFIKRNDKLFFDLINEACDQLRELNPKIEIQCHNHCTCCSNEFHSYRSNKTKKRNWNIFISKNN